MNALNSMTPDTSVTLPSTALDIALGDFLTQFLQQQSASLAPQEQAVLKEIVVAVSQDLAKGHSCSQITCPQQLALLTRLTQLSGQPQTGVSENQTTPLIYEPDTQKCYFHRYWQYETQLAAGLKQKINGFSPAVADLQSQLSAFFPDPAPTEIDYQRLAVEKTLQENFSIISGGPGTGKTTTVVKALALMLQNHPDWHIALAAPTGKAAMRLQTSIGAGVQGLACDEAIKKNIPQTVQTLHRLLGVRYRSPYFKHYANNPLPFDVVVVDEASMIDLALMSKLVNALKPTTKLLLLGDKDQLASVESGSVLADLTQALPAQTHELHHSYRFKGEIKQLADWVNQKNTQAWAFLTENASDTGMIDVCEPDVKTVMDYALNKLQPYLKGVTQFDGSEMAFKQLYKVYQGFQILCSNRKGRLGVVNLNQTLVKKLSASSRQGHWFHGRPVMILENQPAIGLYNGDIGICLHNEDTQKMQVWFEQPDGSIKHFLPSRLPACETTFAMTIHKSQGSEFEEVMICLSDLTPNPVMTKELVYTAITRAKKRAILATKQANFHQALRQDAIRISGLSEKLAK